MHPLFAQLCVSVCADNVVYNVEDKPKNLDFTDEGTTLNTHLSCTLSTIPLRLR